MGAHRQGQGRPGRCGMARRSAEDDGSACAQSLLELWGRRCSGGLVLATGPRVLWTSHGENEGGKKTGPAAQDGLQVREENRKETVKGRVGRLGRVRL
jgi:hypothetical protein